MELTKGVDLWEYWWRVTKTTTKETDYIRGTIPQSYRVYEDSGWWVHNKYIDSLKKLSGTHQDLDDPYAVLHLRPTAPSAIIKAAWRELAKLLHPDHGGNAEAFQKAKAAYDKIKTKE